VKRLQKGIDMGAANSLLLKLNQIGTVKIAACALPICIRQDMDPRNKLDE
jgi:enolase